MGRFDNNCKETDCRDCPFKYLYWLCNIAYNSEKDFNQMLDELKKEIEQVEERRKINMIKKDDYRKMYKHYFKIDFNERFDIHHIDFNHENNDINNLILLPKELHNKYHNLLVQLNFNTTLDYKINLLNGQTFNITALKELCEVMEEINYWKHAKTMKYKGVGL